jgi:hypothetical protein
MYSVYAKLSRFFIEPTSEKSRIRLQRWSLLLLTTPLARNAVHWLGGLSDKGSVPIGG